MIFILHFFVVFNCHNRAQQHSGGNNFESSLRAIFSGSFTEEASFFPTRRMMTNENIKLSSLWMISPLNLEDNFCMQKCAPYLNLNCCAGGTVWHTIDDREETIVAICRKSEGRAQNETSSSWIMFHRDFFSNEFPLFVFQDGERGSETCDSSEVEQHNVKQRYGRAFAARDFEMRLLLRYIIVVSSCNFESFFFSLGKLQTFFLPFLLHSNIKLNCREKLEASTRLRITDSILDLFPLVAVSIFYFIQSASLCIFFRNKQVHQRESTSAMPQQRSLFMKF